LLLVEINTRLNNKSVKQIERVSDYLRSECIKVWGIDAQYSNGSVSLTTLERYT